MHQDISILDWGRLNLHASLPRLRPNGWLTYNSRVTSCLTNPSGASSHNWNWTRGFQPWPWETKHMVIWNMWYPCGVHVKILPFSTSTYCLLQTALLTVHTLIVHVITMECTIFVLIAAHTPIITHPSYFEVINRQHLPRSTLKAYWVQYDWKFAWKWPKSYIFGSILVTNIGTNKRPPKMIYLSALGAYWNEYSTCGVHLIPVRCTYDIHVIPKWCTYDDITFQHIYTAGCKLHSLFIPS